MILVDIYVPAVNQWYEFKLDEYANISDIVTELNVMLLSTEEGRADEKQQNLYLCNYDTKQILPHFQNLHQCGVGSGSHLLLI